jgi:hypothetical protein
MISSPSLENTTPTQRRAFETINSLYETKSLNNLYKLNYLEGVGYHGVISSGGKSGGNA